MFEWNHNTHYHNYILQNLSLRKIKVLDIGSGHGLLSSKLSSLFNKVVSFEPDLNSLKNAEVLYKSLHNIHYIHDDFLSHDFGDNKFDSIVAIASMHHMDYAQGLEKMLSLLDKNGRLVILGLYKEANLIDYLVSLIAILPNFILNRLSNNGTIKSNMVTRKPELTIKEIYSLSDKILDSFKIKRHLFWRYSLVYEKTD